MGIVGQSAQRSKVGPLCSPSFSPCSKGGDLKTHPSKAERKEKKRGGGGEKYVSPSVAAAPVKALGGRQGTLCVGGGEGKERKTGSCAKILNFDPPPPFFLYSRAPCFSPAEIWLYSEKRDGSQYFPIFWQF